MVNNNLKTLCTSGHGLAPHNARSTSEDKKYEYGQLPSISIIPLEILSKIFCYTNLSDRPALQKTCRTFYEAGKIRGVLVSQFNNTYPDIVDSRVPLGDNPKLIKIITKKTGVDFTGAAPAMYQRIACRLLGFICTHTLEHPLSTDVAGFSHHQVVGLSNNRLVSSSRSKALKVWDLTRAEGERCTHTLEGHEYQVTNVAVLSDNRLVSASRDGTLRVWDLTLAEEERCIHIIRAQDEHNFMITHITALSKHQLVVGFADGTLKVWDLEGEHCTHTLEGHTEDVKSVAVLPDNRLASASRDGTLRVWDLTRAEGERCTCTLTGHEDWVLSVAVLPDNRLVSASADGTLKVWDLLTLRTHTLRSHTGVVNSVAVLPDNRLVSASDDGTLKLWDLTRAEGEHCTHSEVLPNNRFTRVAVLPGNRLVTAFAASSLIKVWLYP